MGCDFYISKVLYIYYNDNNYLNIEIDLDRGYYNFNYDEDEEDYEKKVNGYIIDRLTPKMKPIIIYNNNKFNNASLEIKYKSIIEKEINKYDKKWSDIIKIVKVEERYERD